jgi:hypothetical protein
LVTEMHDRARDLVTKASATTAYASAVDAHGAPHRAYRWLQEIVDEEDRWATR